MHPHYHDILDKITDPPQWWTEDGVPRFCVFTPRECGVYACVVALVDIACQDCGQRFRVAVEFDRLQRHRFGDKFTLPSPGDIGSFHYGDPPNHGCVGDTMNIESVSVLELWEKPDFTADGAVDMEWHQRNDAPIAINEHLREEPSRG